MPPGLSSGLPTTSVWQTLSSHSYFMSHPSEEAVIYLSDKMGIESISKERLGRSVLIYTRWISVLYSTSLCLNPTCNEKSRIVTFLKKAVAGGLADGNGWGRLAARAGWGACCRAPTGRRFDEACQPSDAAIRMCKREEGHVRTRFRGLRGLPPYRSTSSRFAQCRYRIVGELPDNGSL